MKNKNHRPLFLFVVSQHAARLALVGGLLKLAGHDTLALRASAAVSHLLQKNPPDMVLADEALPAAERAKLRACVEACPSARRIRFLEFSEQTLGVDDQSFYVIGKRVCFRSFPNLPAHGDGESGV